MKEVAREVLNLRKTFVVLLCLSTAGYAADDNTLTRKSLEGPGQSKNIKSGESANEIDPPHDPRACVVPGAIVPPTKPRSTTTAAFKTIGRDRTCLLSAEIAFDRYKQNKLRIVDVRDAEAFALYRIPGSLNISLHAIKTKSFLKNYPIGLVDEGHSSGRLESACTELKEQGFRKLIVVDGGLSAWRESAGPIAGDALAQQTLNRLQAGELFGERQYDDWLVIDISGKAHNKSRKWLSPNIAVLNPSSSITEIKQRIQQAKKKNPHMRVLIADESGSGYNEIEKGLRRAGVTQVFYLESGLASYDVYVNGQMAVWNQKDKPVSLPACRG